MKKKTNVVKVLNICVNYTLFRISIVQRQNFNNIYMQNNKSVTKDYTRGSYI